MEEDALSMESSNAKMNVTTTETSASNSSHGMLHPSKRARNHNKATSLARFKGVVPQQNGHWGAQIYANHQRVWLGTFKSEQEAAMAYDSAAIKLRSGDSHRNFQWTDVNIQEPDFQSLYTAEAVLNMIRDGSYQAKFADFLRSQSQVGASINKVMVHSHVDGQFSCTLLFQKELTPSDVGKLNRLVIPKKFAVKYFPYICDNNEENGGDLGVDDIELVFYDRLMRSWKFRYCYWRSSQSFVFTRGWNRFVKERNLKEKDIITFYACENADEKKRAQNFFLIDVNHFGEESSALEGERNYNDEMPVELDSNLAKNFSFKIDEDEKEVKQERILESRENTVEDKGFRLFGVLIN